tara:strand:+ start:514 stop:1380 length:867 start_codon:yes stop_codon:yes gene_type:complete
MKANYPRYNIKEFTGDSNQSLFYMTRLEKLVQEFKGINNAHTHSFYLIMWITQGTGVHTIDFKSYTVKSNQLYFLTPGQVHSWELSEDISGFNLYFEAQFFQTRFSERFFQYPFFHSHQHKPILETEYEKSMIASLFENAYTEYKNQFINRDEVFLSFLHLILEFSNRLYSETLSKDGYQFYEKIRNFENLIEAHFLEIRDLKTYANLLNISPNHLNYICKAVLDKTASQLYFERLIIESKRLLQHTMFSTKEIGFKLNFDDPSYFIRFFKKHTGQTPKAFRESLLGI